MVQTIVSQLKLLPLIRENVSRGAGFVLANGSMLSHQSGDGDIRQVVFAPAWRTIKDAIRSSISTSQNQTHAAI
jgi:hypothetical protein